MITQSEKNVILKWANGLFEAGFILFILVAPIKEHTNTLKALGLIIPIVCWLVRLYLSEGVRWVSTPLDYPFLIFIIISILSIFVSVNHEESTRAFRNFLLKFIVIYFTLTNNIKDAGAIKRFLTAFAIISGIISIISIFNYFSGNVVRGSVGSNAFSLNHIGLARFLVVTIPLIGILAYLNRFKNTAFIYLILLAISIVSLILSYSRGGWLVFFTSLIIWGLFKNRKSIAISIVLCVVAALFIAPESIKSRVATGLSEGALQNRPAYWKAGVSMIAERPLLGFGYSVRIFKDLYPNYIPAGALNEMPRHIHSTYLSTAVESGVFALIVLLWIFFVYIKTLVGRIREKRCDADEDIIYVGILCSAVAFMVFAIVEPMMIDQEGMYFWIIAGMGMALLKQDKNYV